MDRDAFKDFVKNIATDIRETTGIKPKLAHLYEFVSRNLGFKDWNDLSWRLKSGYCYLENERLLSVRSEAFVFFEEYPDDW